MLHVLYCSAVGDRFTISATCWLQIHLQFGERSCLQGVRQRVTDQEDACCLPLVSEHEMGVSNCTYTTYSTHAHTHIQFFYFLILLQSLGNWQNKKKFYRGLNPKLKLCIPHNFTDHVTISRQPSIGREPIQIGNHTEQDRFPTHPIPLCSKEW